jgi:hypothetical protein
MEISSAKVKYSEDFIDVVYDYSTTYVERDNGKLIVSTHSDNVGGDFYSTAIINN